MEAVCSFNASVDFFNVLHAIPKEKTLHKHRYGNLKSLLPAALPKTHYTL
jgi:hypothetical protein